jgi:transcriptional regulator with XRE-family HTH domain
MTFNKEILNLYLESGLSQRQFAKDYKVNYSHLNHVLNNEVGAGIELYNKIVTNMGKTLKIIVE